MKRTLGFAVVARWSRRVVSSGQPAADRYSSNTTTATTQTPPAQAGFIQAANADTASEIANYMEQNPSLQIALDGSRDLGANDARSQRPSDRRAGNVRAALIKAGVPAYRIRSGTYADPQLRQERQVAVLLRTSS